MNPGEIIIFNTRILFVALSIVAIIDYVRRPTARRRDFVLMSSALGLPLGITLVRSFYPFQSPFLDLVGAFALFSQPYFLFRLLQYFRPSKRGIGIAILAGFLLSCALLWFRMSIDPVFTVTIIFSYCAIAEAYCTWGFYRGMKGTVGTLRLRLHIITLSSAVFALAFAINALKALFPALSPTVTPIAQVAAAISAVLFYVAFVPPRWLRRAWQMEELYDYLSENRIASASDKFVTENLQHLSWRANQVTNGMAGGVVQFHELATKWEVITATDPTLFTRLLQEGQKLLDRAWQQCIAMSHSVRNLSDMDERRQLRILGAKNWLFVPIQGRERLWGLLVVALQDRSLFIEDDLSLLALLARQCALVLDNHHMVDELQDYSGHLERKVEERTAALQRSNEELRRYAYVASHDLQEPLRTVTSYLQLIEQRFPDKLDAEGREFIAFAVEGAMRMKHLINDLLAYSRVETRACNFVLLDMQQVLDKTKQSLETTIKETNAHITHDPLPQIVGDEVLMLQLFQNLISNAIKYRGTKQPEIHINVNCKDQQWIFSVRDNGIGIEEQFLERIFILFQRLHTSEKYPGTGIGLAVCKKAIERHDGQIWAESKLNEGTTFHFTIPVRAELSKAS
jgi:signal transduction histidine kinase